LKNNSLKKLLLVLPAVCGLFAGCQSEMGARSGTTKSNIRWKVVDAGAGQKVETGDVLRFDCQISVPAKADTVLYSTYLTGQNAYYQIGNPHNPGDFEEALPELHEGDSAVFLVKAADYYTHTRQQALPPFIPATADLQMKVRVLQVFNPKSELTQYAETHKFPEIDANTGLSIRKLRVGSGALPKPGQRVVFNYVGKTLGGTIFDQSAPNIPMNVPLDKHTLNEGLLRALLHMQKGEKAEILIPAALAFPGRSPYKELRPYSNVVLQVDLLDVRE